jgi:tRNA pseudouridine38-40 synthase
LNIDNIKECAKVFIGEHDFRAFVTENKEKLNCIRTISNVEVNLKDEILEIVFTGNGFLKYQVRNMVGILIRTGEDKITKNDIKKILDSKDRSKSGKTAPPEGLYLVDIKY